MKTKFLSILSVITANPAYLLKFTLLLVVPFFCFGLEANAQNPDLKRTAHWYFGNKCGLDFSSGLPVADTTGKLACQSNSAVMSDTSGKLLFYTDGKTVWNSHHVMMQNGDTIGVAQYAEPRNKCVIVPQPGNDSIYYIFTVDGYVNGKGHGLMYSTVNMNKNSGLGSVMIKARQLFTPAAEEVAATKDASGCGYWIAGHERHNDKFRAYHLTETGLDTIPVFSNAGTDYSIPQQDYALSGGRNLKFSPKGNLAAVLVEYDWVAVHKGFDFIDVLQFDNTSGIFSTLVSLQLDTTTSLGLDFSPNGSVFYQESGYWRPKIYQYDLSNIDSLAIINSKQKVFTSSLYEIAGDFLIGMDGRLFSCAQVGGDSLSYISNPDVIGVGCGVHKGGIPLNGRAPNQGLPNFVSNFLINDAAFNCKPNGIEESIPENDILFYPNPADEEIIIKTDIVIRKIEVIDMLGRILFSKQIHSAEFQFNCEGFPNGIYLLKIQKVDYKIQTNKISISHN